jgi:PadR family transcriptional regulator, regulatory protein PadR
MHRLPTIASHEQGRSHTGNLGHAYTADAPLHGYGIAHSIRRISDDVLTVEEGSLYPALQRLLQGWVKAEWKTTETKRRARFYTLTAAGKNQLGLEVSQFRQMMAAIGRVLADAEEGG